jgi:competence protein ComEC
MTAAGTVAVALAGLGFAVAIQLRVDQARHHPIADRFGTVAAVIVTPSESPRSLGGNRMMFRGSLRSVESDEMSGRVVVFTPVTGFTELTAGQPAAFDARITRPTRRDLTVAVLSSTGEASLGEANAVNFVGV